MRRISPDELEQLGDIISRVELVVELSVRSRNFDFYYVSNQFRPVSRSEKMTNRRRRYTDRR